MSTGGIDEPWDSPSEPDTSGFVGGPSLDPRDEGWDASPEEWAEFERGQWEKARWRREQAEKQSENNGRGK